MGFVNDGGDDPSQRRPHRPTILVVDDESTLLFAYKRVLEKAGYHVVTAHFGAQLDVANDRGVDFNAPNIESIKDYVAHNPTSAVITALYTHHDNPYALYLAQALKAVPENNEEPLLKGPVLVYTTEPNQKKSYDAEQADAAGLFPKPSSLLEWEPLIDILVANGIAAPSPASGRQ